MNKKFNKLVRNRIPEIITKEKGRPHITILNKRRYKKQLLEKLVEEAIEAKESKNKKELMKELADVMEVLKAIVKVNKIDKIELRKIQNQRKKERGGFEKRIFLKYVENCNY